MNKSNQSVTYEEFFSDLELNIASYEKGKIQLPELAQNLSCVMSGMVNIPDTWHRRFMKYWGAIEEVNALALDKGSCKPLPGHQMILSNALAELKSLIREEFGVT
jgi:hypothetical protein